MKYEKKSPYGGFKASIFTLEEKKEYVSLIASKPESDFVFKYALPFLYYAKVKNSNFFEFVFEREKCFHKTKQYF